MSSVTVNVSFQDRLLADIDRVARQESRSRSELLREAARLYINQQDRWNRIFRLAESRAAGQNVTEQDVLAEIHSHREQKKS